MRKTIKYMESEVEARNKVIRDLNDLCYNKDNAIKSQNDSISRMLVTLEAQKQALRLAGETIKKIADAIPAK